MANPTGGFGLRAVRRIDGAALSFQIEERQIAYNESSIIATGALVKSLTTGYIDLFAPGDTRSAGVFLGCSYLDPNLGYVTWRPIWNAPTLPSTTIVKAYLIIDPNIVFEGRSSGAAITRANIGENIDIGTVSQNLITGQSTTLLDVSTLNTTNTLPLRIVGLGQGVGNDNSLANNIVEVRLNTSDLQSSTGLA